MREIVLKGIPAAPGIASGSAFILDKQEFNIPKREIMDQEVPIEIARFEEALIKTREEIFSIKDKIQQDVGGQHAQIFDAHLLVLEDRTMIEEVIKGIKSQHLAAEYVFSNVLKKYVKAFSKIQDEYLRERTSDVNDIGRRVLKQLMDESKLHDFEGLTEEIIIVAHDLSPSDAVSLYNNKIIGFVTDIGGRTSHTAIIAKSLGVPAVVGLKDATLKITNQDFIIVDGRQGLIIINPTHETQETYQKEHTKMVAFRVRLDDIKGLPTETLDGHKVSLLANLELSTELKFLQKFGAEGIGLYRTEFLYMNRVDLPSEDEQYLAYKNVADTVAPNPVTIRTLDIGGDKYISSVEISKDMYPNLNMRAIRFCLKRPDIFKTQLRAILRASVHGKLKLMYPMISGLDELRQANALLEEVKKDLKNKKIPFDEKIPVGVMIEVPSAVMVSDLLAKEAKFFSIGTNDLIQYTLAIDRLNEKAANLYEPAHPAILRMIKRTIDAGHNEKIDVSICGEVSSEPYMVFLLLGMGIDALSMSASSILQVKKLIRSLRLSEVQHVTEEALSFSTGQEVEAYVNSKLRLLASQLNISEEKK